MSIDALDPESMTALVQLIKAGTITDKSGIEVLRVMLDERKSAQPTETPAAIVKRLNLAKTSDNDDMLNTVIREVIIENPKAVTDYQNGIDASGNFLVGQAMKKTRGRSDPRT